MSTSVAALYIGESADSLSAVRAPVDFGVTMSDVDATDTGRPASGVMVRTVVRGGETAVRSLKLKWQLLPVEDASAILQALAHPFVFIKYQDPYSGTWRTAEFYASDRECNYKRLDPTDDCSPYLGDLSFTLIER